MESNLPEPEPAASEPPVTAPVPPMIAPEPPVTVPVPPVTVSPTEVPLGSVATGLESGYVTPVPKGISKPRTSGEQQNGEIRFAPVTAAGISAFFAAMRRPNTQVSFTTQGSQDMEITQQPAPEESQDVAAAPTQEIAPEVAPATEVPIPPAASTPTPTVVGATPKPDDETVVGTTPKPDETVVGTTPKPDETVEGPTPRPDETVVGTEVDRFVADLTALAETMPVDTTPAPAPSNASNGTTPNGLVDALNNLANRIPSVTDAVTDGAGDGLIKKQQKAQYMRYYRSVRGPNCPDIIKKKFQEAQSCSPMESQAKIQALFEEFKQCNEDWLTSQIVLKEIRSHTTSHQGIWKWMTRDESWLQVTLFFQTAYMCL